MKFIQIYDPGVAQYAYILGCENTGRAIVIDPQRRIEGYLKLAEKKNLEIIGVAETHIHADFLSGTQEFIERLGTKAYLSSHGEGHGWAYEWAKGCDGIEFVKDGDTINIGDLSLEIVHTPGHTPEHIVFLVTAEGQDVPIGVVSGDFIFAGDLGRPDLLEKAAKEDGKMKEGAESLYSTTQDFKKRDDGLLVWPGHGAGSACGKSLGSMPHTSWGYEKKTSEVLQYDQKQEFVEFITSAQKEPPLYFARMKHLNRDGKALLANQEFKEFTAAELAAWYDGDEKKLLIDIREDRAEAMQERAAGAFYASFGSISTAVGSMIEDAERQIVIIGDEEHALEVHKRLNNIGYDNIAGFVSSSSFKPYLEDQGKESIPVTDFDSIQNEMDRLAIVDVRSGSEYDSGHIEGAIHAPYTRLPESLGDLPRDKTLYVHCGSGMRASIAVSYLKAQGFDVVLINDMFGNAKTCDAHIKACA